MPFDEQKKDDHEDGDDPRHDKLKAVVNLIYINFAEGLDTLGLCRFCGHMLLMELTMANLLGNEFDKKSAIRFLAKDGVSMLHDAYKMAFDESDDTTELRP